MKTQTRSLAATLFPVGVLLIAMASIQSGASLAKSLFPLVGPGRHHHPALAVRQRDHAVVAPPMAGQVERERPEERDHHGAALGGMNFLFYMSLQTVPLGIAVALEFTGPLAVALYASRRAVDFLWIGLAVVGLLLLIPIGETGASLDLKGASFALVPVSAAVHSLWTEGRRRERYPTAALGVVIAALFVAPIGIVQAGSALLNPALIPVALGVAILSTALPYSLEMVALTRLPARTFGTLMSIEPAIGAMCGLIFLNEVLSLAQWLAIGAIITASVGATLSLRKDSPPPIAAD